MNNHYTYPAFFYVDKDGVSVEFPDLPGCLPCAHSKAEALEHAKEAMRLHLYGLKKDGDPIPDPTPVSQLSPDNGGEIVLVDAFISTDQK